MRRTPPNGTPVYARQHRDGPTLAQLNAVDLLAAGKTDTEAAALLNVHRTSVTKWRCYDPVFQAALNRRRQEIWAAGGDLLRSLIPRAIDALAAALEEPDTRVKAALELLRLAPPRFAEIGPTDPDEIVKNVVDGRRRGVRGPLDELVDAGNGLPPYDQHVEAVRRELETLAGDPDPTPAMAAEGTAGGAG